MISECAVIFETIRINFVKNFVRFSEYVVFNGKYVPERLPHLVEIKHYNNNPLIKVKIFQKIPESLLFFCVPVHRRRDTLAT